MLKTVEGIYQNGQIQLAELPPGIKDSTQVPIAFLDPDKLNPTQLRQLIDPLETLLGIQQSFNEVNAGQTRPIGDLRKLRQTEIEKLE